MLRHLALVALLLAVANPSRAQTPDDPPRQAPPAKKSTQDREGKLREGDVAPDFSLKDLAGKATTTLSELKGKPVVLYFGSCT